jgi:predicted DNA-binding transcriptional regulator YafY
VDRLSDPRSTRFRFEPREVPGGDPAAFVSAGLASLQSRYQVVVEIATAAADVEMVVGRWGTVEPVDARSCRLRMSVDALDWPTMVLAAVGADFTVMEPPELLEYVHATGATFARAANGRNGR